MLSRMPAQRISVCSASFHIIIYFSQLQQSFVADLTAKVASTSSWRQFIPDSRDIVYIQLYLQL